MSTSELWSTSTTAPSVCTTHGAMDPVQITRALPAIERVLRCHHVGAPARVRLTGPPCVDGPMPVQATVAFRDAAVRVRVRIVIPRAEAARS
ncbi:hypothetical protein [Nocardia vinacea]|uniref:hypothetical protein n=1 Tax=Nocardia vinacea TaxID=96468 RepID=UPI0002EB5B94|nr:hypothetical protein [Nocardia vinacea]